MICDVVALVNAHIQRRPLTPTTERTCIVSTNPFDDPDASYCVVVNDEGQHSLWLSAIEVPEGWEVRLRDVTRSAALDYVNEHWTDMRPRSLVERMEG